MFSLNIIEIDNDERGVIGDFTTMSDIRITKADKIFFTEGCS